MKIKVTKQHSGYTKGEHEVEEERGNYLIRVGVAEAVKPAEKEEHKEKKEKVENVKHMPKNEK